MGSEITCLIADDHEAVREGLRLSLSRAPHIRVVGEATDGASAVALYQTVRESLAQAARRSPSSVRVTVEQGHEGSFVLEVRDNGHRERR